MERISPELERAYSRLLWMERRRARITDCVASHFGRPLISKLLEKHELTHSALQNFPILSQVINEDCPSEAIRALASDMEIKEAKTITLLQNHASSFKTHVEEQILFGARSSGQDAGRYFLSQSRDNAIFDSDFSIAQVVQAVFELSYEGHPHDSNFFIVARSIGSTNIHYERSAHLISWKAANADINFLVKVRAEWIRGIIDILSPKVQFCATKSIELGDAYGHEHYSIRGIHADP